MRWSAADIPDLSGRTVLVTGANSGLGFETAKALAASGATVALACRRREAGDEAVAAIRGEHPSAALELVELDLADLGSVRAAAESFVATRDRLDALVNNAGVMAIPRRTTADGFEMQFGTNHLGHFALAGRLLEILRSTPASRVVTVSSLMHRPGRIDFDDLHGERRYGKWKAYCQSKLANLLFTRELQRRLAADGAGATVAVAAHPGYSHTNLQTTGPRMSGSSVMEKGSELANHLVAQSAAMGALPTLYAATAPGVAGDDYFGPGGPFEMRGHPRQASRSRAARDDAVARRLWDVSAELTGVSYPR